MKLGPAIAVIVCILIAGTAWFRAQPNSVATPIAVETSSQPTQWTISYEGKQVMVYAFDPRQFKPYVKVLNTLDEYGVLRDSPPDHLHHHGLMYGIKVNGINFWEETSGSGIEKVVESSPPEIGRTAAGVPQARIVQTLHWLAPEDAFLPKSNAPPLLIERRTLVLTLDKAHRETALEWKSEFEVGSKSSEVTLTGANYNGLGIRFVPELDAAASHFSPEGKLSLSNNEQDVSPHFWEAVAFAVPGKPATIALFGAPDNARGDSRFFAMEKPFTYLSATQGLTQVPLIYTRGEHFTLNYLVVLYPELESAKNLDERGRRWIAALSM